MEVPPGRVERIADGGPEAIRSILAELRAMKFNGVLKAAVEGIGDPDEVLDQAIAQEAREREVYEKQLEARRGQERTLVEREEELYRRKWELEQEYQRSAMRQRELDSLRAELQTVKEAS